MIEKMCKVHCAARARDRERLLDAVRDLGVVHLVPVEPARAQAPEATVEKIDMLGRAVQVLGQLEAAGPAPDLAPEDAAREVLTLSRRAVELRSRLGALYRQVEQLAMWGDTPRAMFEELCRVAGRIRQREMGAAWPMLVDSARLHLDHITRGGDPFETQMARPLDFGHWSAHRLESMTGYRLRHGEAVAMGVAIDTVYSSLVLGLAPSDADRVLGCLRDLGLPLSDPALDATDDLFRGLEEFRQHLGGQFTLTMVDAIGHSVDVHEIDRQRMRQAIQRVRTGR